MMNLITLPPEILHNVYFTAGSETCLNLRLTCHLLADIGRQWIFRCVTLRPSPKNYERHRRVLADSSLSQFVSKIYLDIRQWDPDRNMEVSEDEPDNENDDTHNEDIPLQALPKEFLEIFRRYLECPSLCNVVLRFHHQVVGEENGIWGDERHDRTFRLNAIKMLVSSLLSAPQLPRELSIQDLHNVHDTNPVVVGMIARVLGGLQSLRLNVRNEHFEANTELDYEYSEPHVFFPKLSSMWLKPAMSNLRHLTIYSSLYFGYYPKLSFTGLYFPQLRTLSFGNLCFIDDSQLDWILSHGSTLTELYLDDCAILYEVTISNNQGTYLDADMYETRAEIYRRFHASYERRWCDYFQAFLGGLPHLQHFRYGSSPCWWVDDSIPFECETEIQIGLHAGSYLVFCEALAPRPYVNRSLSMDMTPKHPVQPLHPTAEDKEALKRLLAKTRQAVELNADDRS